jgi:hypothetical protein
LFFDVKVAVLGAVTETVLRVGRRALKARLRYEVGDPSAHASHGEDRLRGTIAAPTFGRAVRAAAVWLPLWLCPVVALARFFEDGGG